jgi:hypothetical protein
MHESEKQGTRRRRRERRKRLRERERAIYSGYARIRQVIIDSYTNQKRIPAATTNEQNNGGGGGGSGY